MPAWPGFNPQSWKKKKQAGKRVQIHWRVRVNSKPQNKPGMWSVSLDWNISSKTIVNLIHFTCGRLNYKLSTLSQSKTLHKQWEVLYFSCTWEPPLKWEDQPQNFVGEWQMVGILWPLPVIWTCYLSAVSEGLPPSRILLIRQIYLLSKINSCMWIFTNVLLK